MRIFWTSPNPEDPNRSSQPTHIQAMLRGFASPGTEIDFGAPDDYPGARVITKIRDEGALPGLHHVISTTAFIRKIVWAQEQGYDAVIQSNTFDPGVEAARLAVSIPVIGVMRTALHHATILAGRIALTVPFQSHVAETWKIVRSYGMEHFVQAIRPVGLYPGNMRDAQELEDKLIEVMRGIVADVSPEMIIPLGGALVPYVVDPKVLERAVGVPVMNTKIVAIRFAETCVYAGLSQSPIAYPKVPLSYEDFQEPAYSASTV
jgi:Asp/Glu/hydantoin racemase